MAQLARRELDRGADDAVGVVGRPEARHVELLVRQRVLGVEEVGERLHRLVAALHRPRPGADDLDEQRARVIGVGDERGQERADALVDAALG
jgi:hypothetical protein